MIPQRIDSALPCRHLPDSLHFRNQNGAVFMIDLQGRVHIIGALPQEAPLPEAPETPPSVHRLALVAVHGVGKTEPGSTARHIADLLLGLGRLNLPSCLDPGESAAQP
jgi:hypothetical protein